MGTEYVRILNLVKRLVATTAILLPDDVYEKLREMASQEASPYGRMVYEAIFKNLELAASRRAPLCQDTGVPEFYVALGDGFPYKSELLGSIREAVAEVTKLGLLRPNVVNPATGRNTGDNTGPRMPWIELEVVPGSDWAEVQLYLAGGGSSRPGRAAVIDPAEGWEGVLRFVVDTVAEYGPPACPPLMVVGVGVGATVEIAASLSKRALLRPLGTRNPDPRIAEIEVMLGEALSELGIGPQGLGGATSIGEVHVEYAGRHPATIAVGVSTACWALRRGWMRIRKDLSYEVLSHRGGLIDVQ